jgi:uncharacterized protein (TIGR00369 family)
MSTAARSLASPFADFLGLVVERWDPEEVRVCLPHRPEMRNVAGAVSGGAIATLIDIAGGMVGCYAADRHARPSVVTLNLNVSFVGPARDGPIFADGRRRGGGASIYTATVDVTDADGRLVATGQGTFKVSRAAAIAADPQTRPGSA